MEKKLKVVTIGGGSSYTPELIEGFIKRYSTFPVKEIWLVDIEEGKEKLQIVGDLAKRMVKKANLPIEIHLTLDRKKALKDADFVITQIRVGLIESRIKDEEITFSHGVLGQETNGPGGIFKALRTIPVILDITKDMEELCKDAWLINFANPSGMVTESVLRYSNIKKVIGLCNVPIHMENTISKLLNTDPSKLDFRFFGLNHMVFIKDIYLEGNSILKEVVRKISKSGLDTMKNITEFEYEPLFIEELGTIFCPYLNYYYKHRQMLEKGIEEYKEGKVRGKVVKEIEKSLFELYKDENLNIKPPQLEKRGGAYYSDAACRLIDSIYNDKKDIQPVDTMNKGAISSIDYKSAVEVSCIIGKNGATPIQVGEFPYYISSTLQQIKTIERLTVEAAVENNYSKIILALTLNPFVQNDILAKKLTDSLIEAHKDYLTKELYLDYLRKNKI